MMENIVLGKLVTPEQGYIFREFGRTEEEVYKRIHKDYVSAEKQDHSLPRYGSFEGFCNDVSIVHMNFGKCSAR